MNKDQVVYPYYALFIKKKGRMYPYFKAFEILANMHGVSLRTFVQCMSIQA